MAFPQYLEVLRLVGKGSASLTAVADGLLAWVRVLPGPGMLSLISPWL